CFDRFAGFTARAQLQNLTEQHQRRNHRSGVEINADSAAVATERWRKGIGKKRRRHAVNERGADADGDEREHIETAVDNRRPTALKKRPAAPKHYRRGENQLNPIEHVRRDTALYRL